ncbi:MAG: NUDIX hydrolase [Promethearchaeota archaeon]
MENKRNFNDENEGIASNNNKGRKDISIEEIREKIRKHSGSSIKINPIDNKKGTKSNSIFKESAVLILIYPYKGDSFSLILTKRNSKLKKHSGEMAFPGGKVDRIKDKTKIDTALRECKEEIGVDFSEIELLGVLKEMHTLTGYSITPVVGIAKRPLEFKINTDEVQNLFIIPIEFFLNRENFQDKEIEINGVKVPIYNFNYIDEKGKKHSIWGATAHIIVQLIRLLFNYNPSKLSYERPKKEILENILKESKQAKEKLKKIKDIEK